MSHLVGLSKLMDWETIALIFPFLLKGARFTVFLTLAVVLISTPLAFAVAVGRDSPWKPLSSTLAITSWVARGIPPLIILFFMFFALPGFGLALSAAQAGVIGMTLYTTFYYAEAVRAGLASADPGQYLAARSLGLTPLHTFRRIILPPAMSSILPPYISYTMDTVKGTSLLAAISVAELMGNAKQMIASTVRPIEILIVVALMYGLFNMTLVAAHSFVEGRIHWR